MGDEVFSFSLSLFPGVTVGDGYSDTSKVDGKVTLRLGCIRIVYLHQFLMALLVRGHYRLCKCPDVSFHCSLSFSLSHFYSAHY